MNEREQKPHEKKQVKPVPAPTPEEIGGLPGEPMADSGAAATMAYADQLGDTQKQAAQRQAMAARIGEVSGNRYLQQVVTQMRQEKAQPAVPEPPQEQSPAQPAAVEQAQDEGEAQAEEAQPPAPVQSQPQDQAQASAAPQQSNQVSARLESLRGMPPTEQMAALAQAQEEIPNLWAAERQAILQTLPPAPARPIGIPTREEATGQTVSPQEATDEAAAETPEVRPAPEQPADPKAAGQADAGAQTRKEETRPPDRAEARKPTNTSAGERPKASLTGPTDPAQIEQKEALSKQAVGDLALQAGQAMQKDYGEGAIYPSTPRQSQAPPPPAPEAQPAPQQTAQPNTWTNVAAEMAEHPQVQDAIAQRREAYQATLERAQISAESTAHQQQRLEGRQAEADSVAGQMRAAVAATPDEQVKKHAEQWLNQDGSFNEQATSKQERLEATHAQAQAAAESAQERQATLPDSDEMGVRMAESPHLKETINAEAGADFEKETATMMAQYQERRAAGQAEIQTKRAEAEQIVADHKVRQQANLAHIQTRAQDDVAQIKEEWQARNAAVIGAYETQTEQTRQQGEQTIAETVAQGEQEADQVLTEAEGEATQTKSSGEADAAAAVSAGQARASAIRASVPAAKEGEEAEHAKAKAAAEKKAEEEVKSAQERAQELLDQMETDVQAILDDASLTAAEKVQQVNAIVEQTITDVNTIMEEERDGATNGMQMIQAEIVCGLIKGRLDRAITEVSESLLEDEVVAARVEEIKEDIRDGTGNIVIDASSLNDGTYPSRYLVMAFRQRMINSLDTLMTRPAGLEIIMQIMDDTETVTIAANENALASASRTNDALELDDGSAGPGCNTTINIHPDLDDDDLVLFDDAGNDIPAPVWLILGHELIHAAHNSDGRNVRADESGADRPPVTSPDYGNLEEEQTITTGDLTENDLREQFGLDGPRHGHGGRIDDDPRTP